MTRFLIVSTLLLVAVYGLMKARPLLLGPSISLNSPVKYAVIPNGITTFSGQVNRTVALTLDGVPVLSDQNGSFSSIVTLPHGNSILTLVASDRFGRRVTTTRTVYVP